MRVSMWYLVVPIVVLWILALVVADLAGWSEGATTPIFWVIVFGCLGFYLELERRSERRGRTGRD